ncbi:hypothetical protein WK25_22800 [Burkholderia latens]|nr:hypothetical protein WK25_22800 [Burkholderia latens]
MYGPVPTGSAASTTTISAKHAPGGRQYAHSCALCLPAATHSRHRIGERACATANASPSQ